MDRTPIKSSNLVSVGYDDKNASMDVEFTGGSVYRYHGVPAWAHQELIEAESAGKYFSRRIKGHYGCTCEVRKAG